MASVVGDSSGISSSRCTCFDLKGEEVFKARQKLAAMTPSPERGLSWMSSALLNLDMNSQDTESSHPPGLLPQSPWWWFNAVTSNLGSKWLSLRC